MEQSEVKFIIGLLAVALMVTMALTWPGITGNTFFVTDSVGRAGAVAGTSSGSSERSPQVNICKDSDGRNHNVRGTTIVGNQSKTDYCRNFNGPILVEYYCNAGKIAVEEDFKCEYGCADGACIEKPDFRDYVKVLQVRNLGSVKDPNVGGALEYGDISKIYGYAVQKKSFKVKASLAHYPNNAQYTLPFELYESATLPEFECSKYKIYPIGSAGVYTTWIECAPKNYSITGGVYDTAQLKISIPAANVYGKQMVIAGVKLFRNGAYIVDDSLFVIYAEVYARDVETKVPNTNSSTGTAKNVTKIVPCPSFVSAGKANILCSRNCSDNSTDCYNNSRAVCSNDIIEPGEQCLAGQTAPCRGFNPHAYVNGSMTCKDCRWDMSQCIPRPMCTNNDGGLNYYVKGVVKGFSSQNREYNMADFCTNNGLKLVEYYCLDNVPKNITTICKCVDGACVRNQTNTTGSLYVISYPPAADTYINEEFKGVTPITVSNLVPGSYIVKLVVVDQYEYTAVKEVVAGQTTVLNITLEEGVQ